MMYIATANFRVLDEKGNVQALTQDFKTAAGMVSGCKGWEIEKVTKH